MMSESVTKGGSQYPEIFPSLEDPRLAKRLQDLKEKYTSTFSTEPEIYIRVPGRVNLIGEHVDYCGYSVCPMAIRPDILLAAGTAKNGEFIKVTNVDDIYPDNAFQDEKFNIDLSVSGWSAYVLCGIRGGLERLGKPSVSLRFAFSGTIPAGSGLSSSSALVCSSLLATTYLNKLILPKSELATLSAECEHYIGTAGGGMDQAIAFCATQGCAKHIKFNPLRTSDVLIPQDAVFVIAHSLIIKNKAESSDFNTRVVETRIAAQILARRQHLDGPNKLRIAEVQAELGVGIEKMISLVKSTFHKAPYTKQEICKELDMSESELSEKVLTPDTCNVSEFKLYQRAVHVVEEAHRVEEWLVAESVDELGSLLSQSHASLRDLYEASHPQLDRLVEECLAAGALGAKLTGAGWGGAVVALTTTDRVGPFLQALATSFYSPFKVDLEEVIFPTEPGPGAQLFLSL